MKILAVIPSLTRGGAERALSLLTYHWVKSHDVVVAAFETSQPAYRFHGRIVDLRIRRPGRPLSRIRALCTSVPLLILLFLRERPDRIITFMEPANFPAILAAAAVRYLDRVIVSVRRHPLKLPLLRRLLIPRLYKLPSVVVAVSQGVRASLIAMGLPPARVTTILNPVSFPPCTANKRTPAKSSRVVLAAGRLIHEKGFDLLLHAFSRLHLPDTKLVVLGEGPQRNDLILLASRLCIRDRVSLPGAVSEISKWYRKAGCFVLSSRTEGWPNVLVEAMAAGCPVVSFSCDFGPAEIVDHERSGLLVEPEDIDALAHAINRVLSDWELSDTLSAGGLQRAAWIAAQPVSTYWLTVS